MKRAWPWATGLVFVLGWFGYWETMAFLHPDRYATLSYTISSMSHAWPPLIFFCGFTAGFLTAHFWWAWRKNPMGDGGG